MPQKYTVKQGDCFSSLAAQFGFPFDTLWNHPDNASIKQQRPDPNVLYPGDIIIIPDKTERDENRAVDNHYKFGKKGDTTHIKIRLLLDDEPRANLEYELQVSGQSLTGTTDGDGYLEQDIPPAATDATLLLGTDQTREIIKLGLGTLDPIDFDDGVRKRLGALGYDVQDLAAAVRAFRTKEGLDPDGGADDDLRSKLKEKFGQ